MFVLNFVLYRKKIQKPTFRAFVLRKRDKESGL